VLLGPSPDPSINGDFWWLKHQLNDNPDCHVELRFDGELAHLLYAGADMIVVPSNFEPCGLVQMIALRYGTVPIVRAVGGLSETVFDRDFADRSPDQRNGYVFHQPDGTGIESAMRRALGLWYDYPQDFRYVMLNGMRYDYSWGHPGQDYLNIYQVHPSQVARTGSARRVERKDSHDPCCRIRRRLAEHLGLGVDRRRRDAATCGADRVRG
jgi:starch synthase